MCAAKPQIAELPALLGLMASDFRLVALGAARQAGIDRAVAFALTSRLWQLVAAPVTLLVIASRFSPDIQGYYYTFLSLLALQSFAELGLSIVIVNVASHEWSRLSLDPEGRLCGEPVAMSRLVGFGRKVFAWYGVAGAMFVAVVGPIGFWFFARESAGQAATLAWQAPWSVLVMLTGAQLGCLAFTALLEGCNQVATVQKFRVIQTMASTTAFWVAGLAGAGLWAAVAIAAVRLVTDLYLIAVRYRGFFAAFRSTIPGPRLSWRDEVWPMQWRLGLSGVVNYFAFSLFTPVMFAYHGATVAGQMGMTMQIVGGVQALAMVFLTTRVPTFGVLIARASYEQLERLWWRTSVTSVVVMAVGGLAILTFVVAGNVFRVPLATRVLGPSQTLVLLATALLLQVSQCQTAYIRAHRRELIVAMSVTTSLATGLLVWTLGRPFGPTGALVGYLAATVVAVAWETAILSRFKSTLHLRAQAAS